MDNHDLLFNGKTAVALYGRAGSNKTCVLWNRIGILHKADAEAIAIVIDTKYRHHCTPPHIFAEQGVDRSRLFIYEQNEPQKIVDHVKRAMELVDGGAPIKMLVISTANGVATRRYWGDDGPIASRARVLEEFVLTITHFVKDRDVNLVFVFQTRANLAENAPRRYLPSPASALSAVDFTALVENGQITEIESTIESTKEKP